MAAHARTECSILPLVESQPKPNASLPDAIAVDGKAVYSATQFNDGGVYERAK